MMPITMLTTIYVHCYACSAYYAGYYVTSMPIMMLIRVIMQFVLRNMPIMQMCMLTIMHIIMFIKTYYTYYCAYRINKLFNLMQIYEQTYSYVCS